MLFSIIIPVRAINDYLKESIDEIKKLQYSDFEVIIIVDSETNYTFSDRRIKVIQSGTITPGEKRNLGAKNSSGDILAFLDDDAYPASDWLLEASKLFENPNIYALGGPAITTFNAGLLERISGKILESWLVCGNTTYRNKVSSERNIMDYPTVNLFVRKKDFIKIGGFTKEFWPGEDTKLCLDLVDYHNKPFLYSPKIVVFHHRRKILFPFLQQISRYGKYRGQFARIFPKTSRLPMYFVPSLFLLFLVFGFSISTFINPMLVIYKYVLLFYTALVATEALKVYLKDPNPLSLFLFLAVTPLVHIVYGFNFLIGFIRKPTLQLKSINADTGNYNEG